MNQQAVVPKLASTQLQNFLAPFSSQFWNFETWLHIASNDRPMPKKGQFDREYSTNIVFLDSFGSWQPWVELASGTSALLTQQLKQVPSGTLCRQTGLSLLCWSTPEAGTVSITEQILQQQVKLSFDQETPQITELRQIRAENQNIFSPQNMIQVHPNKWIKFVFCTTQPT